MNVLEQCGITGDGRLETFIEAAHAHGMNSDEPDHEVGDLQELLRAAWELLSEPAKRSFVDTILADAELDVIEWRLHADEGFFFEGDLLEGIERTKRPDIFPKSG